MQWSKSGWLFLLYIQLGNIVTAKQRIPTLLILRFNKLISEVLTWLYSKCELACQDCSSQLPSVETIVDSDNEVGVVDNAEWIFDELLVLDFVGIEHFFDLLSRSLLFHL